MALQVFLPDNLNLEKLLEDNPPTFKYKIDNFKYIVGTLIKLKVQFKDYQKEEYIPLNAQILQDKIREYNLYLNYLVNNGVLEVANDGWYIVGKKSRCYKLSEHYQTKEISSVDITRKSLIKKSNEDKEKQKQSLLGYTYLTRWFNPALQINYRHADGYLLNKVIKEKGELGFKKAWNRYQYAILSVRMLDNGDYNLFVDDTANRFHSNITNLRKDLRAFVTYSGEKILEIDLKNSQPFFSTILLDPSFYEEREDTFTLYSLSKDIYQRIQPNIPTILSLLPQFPSFMLVKSHDRDAIGDLELYCTLVDKGKLYEYFNRHYREATGILLDLKNSADKRTLKEGLFYCMYAHNKAFGEERGTFKRVFMKLFPTVHRIFSLLRRIQYKDISAILQSIESHIMLRRVALRISQDHPEVPLFTIHDCIATTYSGKDIVYQSIKEQCHNLIGLEPSLDVVKW